VGDLSASLPSYFGLKGVRAVKERGCYLVDNAKIHKTSGSGREIVARYNLLKQLEQAGFPFTDGLIPAASGVPFVNLGREMFVMTRHVPGCEPDMEKLEDMTVILEGLARFHKAARGLNALDLEISQPLPEVFAKQTAALSAAVKQVNRRPRFSDFDVLMLKHAEAYANRAASSAKVLAATDYTSLHADAVANKHICHNALKEETFSVFEQNCYITRFEEAAFDLQLNDLACVLRRYAVKSSREIPITQLVEIYDRILPLPASGKNILFALLSFPWAFMKVVSQFYSKKRNFIPAGITSRMTAVLDEQDVYDGYVSGLE
jgi:CotS family spore coat protein